MLDLFLGPVVGCGAEIRVVVENAAKILGIVAPITLHHRRGLHQRHECRVNVLGIEPVPGYILDPPMFHPGNMLAVCLRAS